MEFIAFRMGRHGIASSRSQVAIFDHYGRLSGLREPIFKPKMLPITNKHLCIFAVLLSFNIIPSFHPLFPFPFLLRIEFFVLFFHQYLSLLNTFSNPILSNSSKLGFYYKKIKQRFTIIPIDGTRSRQGNNNGKYIMVSSCPLSIFHVSDPVDTNIPSFVYTNRLLAPFPFYNLHSLELETVRLRVIDAPRRTKTLALWEPRKWSKKSGIRIAWDGTRGTNEWIDGHGHYVVTRVLKWSTLNILIVLYPASWSHLCFHETVSYSRHAFSIITWEDHLGIPPSWLIRTIKRIVNYRIYLCSPLSFSLSFESSIL